VAEILSEGGRDEEPIAEVVRQPVPIRVDTELPAAVTALITADPSGLPVLDHGGTRLVGWITHQSALAAAHGHHERQPEPQAA
jgi:CIC family chloride channel protein